MKKRIMVEGMCCKNCTIHVKEALEKLDEVTKAKVKLSKNEVIVKLKENVSDDSLIKAIEDVDYKVTEII